MRSRSSTASSVVERLLEHPLEGEFAFEGHDGPRRVRIRAKADRIDLLTDGTLRIVDYKLGRAPKTTRALQLPVYGVCAAARSTAGTADRGRSRAGYVAFREKNAFVALGGSSSLAEALADGQERLLGAVAGIERGEFPVDPDEPFLCTRCGYAASAARTTSVTSRTKVAASANCRSSATATTRCRSEVPSAALHRAAAESGRGCQARASPSIPRTTSCSRPRPAPARRRCWSRATSTC